MTHHSTALTHPCARAGLLQSSISGLRLAYDLSEKGVWLADEDGQFDRYEYTGPAFREELRSLIEHLQQEDVRSCSWEVRRAEYAASPVGSVGHKIFQEILRDEKARRDGTGEYAGLDPKDYPPRDRPREPLPFELADTEK